MKLDRPQGSSLTQAELDNLDILKALVEGAISDGVLTKAESENIRSMVWADGKISPEELHIIQNLIWNKIQTGELTIEWTTP